ncbi:hypothetical protein M0805_006249 [Coniferiporia weirii]|nr:hypothetical protein M0805_006249 [Coniferiporia weirii]
MEFKEYQESSTVRLDWTVRGLKNLFESSKGEAKSKVTRSVKFGGGRWQILFYPNSGTEGGQHISLYLSCEPTLCEKNNTTNGNWVREGLYKFSFELRNVARTVLFNQKEANDHSFSWKTANWGWAQFARRETVYYQPNTVRNHDAFLITCTISSSPVAPSVPPPVPQRPVPVELLDVVGSLLDDPTYSDVVFVLPGRVPGGRGTRKIFAARSILVRAEYFESMFGSGFAESFTQTMGMSPSQLEPAPAADGDFDTLNDSRQLEDSDIEDEKEPMTTDEDEDDYQQTHQSDTDSPIGNAHAMATEAVQCLTEPDSPILAEDKCDETMSSIGHTNSESTRERNVRLKLPRPPSLRQNNLKVDVEGDIGVEPTKAVTGSIRRTEKGPRKTRIVTKDVAYSTYWAVLYYLYTDAITFAPLASSFLTPPSTGPSVPSHSLSIRSQGEGQNLNPPSGRFLAQTEHNNLAPPTRRAWIRDWERQNPGRVKPCSAKAVYRVADKLGLNELRCRAFQVYPRAFND